MYSHACYITVQGNCAASRPILVIMDIVAYIWTTCVCACCMWTRSCRNSDAVYTKITFIRFHIALSAPMQVVQASASVGLCLVCSTPPGLREGSSSASPLGRYAAAASQSQETQTQTGSHIHLMRVCGEEECGKEGRG